MNYQQPFLQSLVIYDPTETSMLLSCSINILLYCFQF